MVCVWGRGAGAAQLTRRVRACVCGQTVEGEDVASAEQQTPRSRFLRVCRANGVRPEPLVVGCSGSVAMRLRHRGIGDGLTAALSRAVALMSDVAFVDLRDNRISGRNAQVTLQPFVGLVRTPGVPARCGAAALTRVRRRRTCTAWT